MGKVESGNRGKNTDGRTEERKDRRLTLCEAFGKWLHFNFNYPSGDSDYNGALAIYPALRVYARVESPASWQSIHRVLAWHLQ